MIYECQYFDIAELVPPEIHIAATTKAEKRRLWMLFDPIALLTLDNLRRRYGVCIVNNWGSGGPLKYRGFRPPGCDVGAAWSQHRFGRAFDCSFPLPARSVRVDLLSMDYTYRRDNGLQHIRRIETGVAWLHFDLGNQVGTDIRVFSS